jgi:nicotinamidase/pyrazinamidase
MMAQKIRLLVIDPQIDFCDGPGNGALPVPGAWDDMSRLATLVDRLGRKIDDIDVTLDSHHAVDIAHSPFWVNSKGDHPAPFTMITTADVENGLWSPRNPAFRARALEYVRKLEASGKYVLIIWPTHCLIGSPGHAVHPELFAALRRWEEREFAVVNYVTKGSNLFTEHYSAIAAEVPDPSDPSTMLNAALIDALRESDVILIAGEAESHCLKATVQDIADNIGTEHVRKFVLLTDCTSAIPAMPGGPDFPAITKAWVADMQRRGMSLSTSTTFLA